VVVTSSENKGLEDTFRRVEGMEEEGVLIDCPATVDEVFEGVHIVNRHNMEMRYGPLQVLGNHQQATHQEEKRHDLWIHAKNYHQNHHWQEGRKEILADREEKVC
jgi:hypothetical protein